MNPINLFDYEILAKERLPSAFWDYYQGGSEDEITLRANRKAFEHVRFRPRVLIDVNTIDLCCTVQGVPISFPLLIAPTAFHCLAHPEGECATAQAASNAGTILVASTFATRRLEEIATVSKGTLWLQLYVYRDLEITKELVRRAEAAGYRAIVLTVDAPRLGRRERDIRNTFTLPSEMQIANFAPEICSQGYIPEPAIITWDTVDWLCSLTSLPIILKGILTAEDAMIAMQYRISGIIVSNHGGRQLDSTISSLDALPDIASALAEKCEIYLDGGIRRGTDILKALALGADAVLIGRPVLWGLAVNGAIGVQHVLSLLYQELALAMALAGCTTLKDISPSLININHF